MERINPYRNIIGDDLPYNTMQYRKVPSGFRFDDLELDRNRFPKTAEVWDRIVSFANKYYADWEIVGITFQDFFENLEIALEYNIDNFEKFLEVYYDDIAQPLQSRTIERIYDITDTDEYDKSTTGTNDTTSTSGNDGSSTDFDLPIDNPDGQATNKTVVNNNATNDTNTSINEETKENRIATKKGTETENWSDVGVAPNYQLLNGFLDYNRSYNAVFVSYFANCFTLMETLRF